MQSEQDLCSQFQKDVNEISQGFIDAYGLKFEKQIQNLSEPIGRWIDFVMRYVPAQPRNIVYSNKFPMTLSQEAQDGLNVIESHIRNGHDLNPFQGRGLIDFNDTSGRRKSGRTDLMFADWGILHFHLTDKPMPSTSYFSERSGWLLFAIVTGTEFGIVDIRDHDEPDLFSNPDLIETVVRSWPAYMERFKVRGILPGSSGPSHSDATALRKNGVNSFLTIDGQVYMGPGMGLSSALTSTKASMAQIKINKIIKNVAKAVHDPDNVFKKNALEADINTPEFSLCMTAKGIAIYEKFGNKAYAIPNDPTWTELCALIAPTWATAYYATQNS